MEAPGNGILKVSGIILVIFAGIAVVTGIIGLAAVSGLAAFGIPTGLLTMITIYAIVSALFSLFVGLMAILNSAKPEKASKVFLLGIIAAILVIVDLVLVLALGGGLLGAWPWISTIIGLVLPVLIIVGAKKNMAAK